MFVTLVIVDGIVKHVVNSYSYALRIASKCKGFVTVKTLKVEFEESES